MGLGVALLVAQLLLAAVFALAGLSKLADLAGSRRALEAFGVPKRAVPGLGFVLPLAELAVAGVLLPSGTARAGAVGAVALLSAFTIAIVVNLVRGRTPECRCFGQVQSARVGWGTVGRNLALAGVAAGAAVGAGETYSLGVAWTAAAGAAILLGALGLVWRGSGRADERTVWGGGLPVGADAPEFELPALEGGTVTLAALRARGKPVLLVFGDVHCGPCVALAPEIARWQREHAAALTIGVIERGHDLAAREPDALDRADVLLQTSDDVSRLYGAEGTPIAVLVDPRGKIASDLAPGVEEIRRLVASETEELPAAAPVASGELFPLGRREFLLRLAGAGATLSLVLALPARAVAGVKAVGGRCGPGEKACGTRCCGRRQTCVGTGAGARCVCADPEAPDRCGKECADLEFGYGGCGECGRACPSGTECHGRDCVPVESGCSLGCHSSFPEGNLPLAANSWCCGGDCVDIRRDESDCGGCGQKCPAGETCCRGVCRNTKRDPAACGGCFDRCPNDKPICHAGMCRDKCPKPLKRCGRTCGNPRTQVCCDGQPIDKDELQFRDDHCGGCKPCPPGTTCKSGKCVVSCPEGQGFCGGRCVDTTSDKANCGTECTECNSSLVPECCGGQCTNLGLNDEHCGACFNRCKPGEFCRFGDCVCPLGQTCG